VEVLRKAPRSPPVAECLELRYGDVEVNPVGFSHRCHGQRRDKLHERLIAERAPHECRVHSRALLDPGFVDHLPLGGGQVAATGAREPAIFTVHNLNQHVINGSAECGERALGSVNPCKGLVPEVGD
jgi:hypothetical protein